MLTAFSSVIRLHSSAAYPTTRSSIFGPSYSAGQRCLSAVENIAALTRLVISNNMLHLLGSTFAFTVWVAARLLLVHASTTEYSTIPDVRLFLDALREMGKCYQTAERYATIIQRVVEELSQTQMQTANGSVSDQDTDSTGSSTRNCVAILSDMRMTAYAVDVMISRQPDSRRSTAHLVISTSNGESSGNNGSAALDYLDVFNWFNFRGWLLGRTLQELQFWMPMDSSRVCYLGLRPWAPKRQTGSFDPVPRKAPLVDRLFIYYYLLSVY